MLSTIFIIFSFMIDLFEFIFFNIISVISLWSKFYGLLTPLTLSLIRKFCSRRLWTYDNIWLKVENIVAKWEIARFVQFLHLSLCFQKAVCCRASESVYMRERVKRHEAFIASLIVNYEKYVSTSRLYSNIF